MLDEAGLLRGGAAAAAATLYAIASESTYLRMTDGAGLSADDYARWLTETLTAALTAGGGHRQETARREKGVGGHRG